MKSLHKLGCAVFSAFVFIHGHAEELPVNLLFVRPLGMGGAFTAVADDHNIFVHNPAGMVQRTGAQTTIFEVAVGGSKDLKDAYDFVSDREDELTNFENLSASRQIELINEIKDTVSKLRPRAYVAADVASFVSGPRFFGLPFHGGFGLFGGADASFRINADFVPTISFDVNNDMVLPLSVAKRWDAPLVAGKIGIGFTGKVIRRRQIKQEDLSVVVLDDLDAPPSADGRGIGSDLGFLYQPTDRWNVGLMVQDFLGTKLKFDAVAAEKGYPAQPARTAVIRPRTNIGLAVTPKKLLWLLPTYERWVLAMDVRDILNKDDHLFFENGFRKPFGENLYTHLHLGVEYRYWFLRLRGGAHQGYPSLGLGIDIPVLKIDYAYYSREIGRLAGDLREENHVISLAFRFGSGHVESRERIKKAKETTKTRDTAIPESDPVPSSTPEEPKKEEAKPSPDNKTPEPQQDLPQ